MFYGPVSDNKALLLLLLLLLSSLLLYWIIGIIIIIIIMTNTIYILILLLIFIRFLFTLVMNINIFFIWISETFICLFFCLFVLHVFIFIGNVAYKKQVSARTVWGGQLTERAVDGDIDGESTTCYKSGSTSSTAWWMLDLGASHVIYNVTVYGTNRQGTLIF